MNARQELQIETLELSKSSAAGATLARAFVDDPMWTAIFPDVVQRQELLPTMFTGLIATTAAAHGVVDADSGLSGVAVWLPPGRGVNTAALVRSRLVLARFVMRLRRTERKRMMGVLNHLNRRRQTLMSEPHWYLQAIGVKPDAHGQGLGSALMVHGITRAEGVPIYLETETESNVAFYERRGFEVVERVVAEGLDIPMWLMLHGTTNHGLL